MNILVIGNGFDLAHGLPTHYKDFWEFIENVRKRYPDGVNDSDSVIEIIKSIYPATPSISNDLINKYIEPFTRFISNNFWRENLNRRIKKDYIGEWWVDFEKEISNIVRDIEDGQWQNVYSSIENNYLLCEDPQLIEKLENDLVDLNKSLEMYILLVSEIEIRPVNGFQEEIRKADYIINFNYTDTYERYFIKQNGEKRPFCPIEFVHGKAGDENIILGAGETLTGDEINTKLSCVKFKKYFQRIHNRTGGKYRSFMNDEKSKIWNANGFLPNTNIHIYGHSLDVTDKDILSYVILHEYTKKVIIYYYEDDTKSDYETSIINLIQVIGKEELTARVGDGRIEFISTEAMI